MRHTHQLQLFVHGSWHYFVDRQFVYNGESISYCSESRRDSGYYRVCK
jgi:hypothetical protein